MKEIVISGYYGFGNSGDDSLLMSIIQGFADEGLKDNLVVLSSNPAETIGKYNVKAINRLNPFSVVWHLIRAKLFVSGGGTLIQDGTSTKSLLYYLYLIALARILGCKTMLYANGIGPVTRPENRIRVRKILNKTDLITLRDRKSQEELKALGVSTPEIVLTADPVFTLKVSGSADEIKKRLGLEKYICVAVREASSESKTFAADIAAALDLAAEKFGFDTVLLPFQRTDREISEKISDAMHSKSYVVCNPANVGDLFELIDGSQLCVGMRLHMLIYAACMGVPLVGIVYDPKVSGFMEYSNQDLFISAEDLTADNLFELIDRCAASLAERRNILLETRERLKALALKNSKLAAGLYNGSADRGRSNLEK